MKFIYHIFALLVAGIILSGCGGSGYGKSDSYRIVYVSKDGSKEIEKIEAKNDTDAVKQFTQKVAAIAFSNLDKEEFPYQDVMVLSPSGEVLNKNKDLMNAVTGNLEEMANKMDEMSNKLDDAFKLSEELDKAIMDGDKKKADSIRAEMDKIKFDDK